MLNKGPEKLLCFFWVSQIKGSNGKFILLRDFQDKPIIFLVKQLDFEDAKQAAQINFEQPVFIYFSCAILFAFDSFQFFCVVQVVIDIA